MKVVYLIIKVFILLVFLVLALCNRQVVQFFYLPGQEVSLPLIVVLFGAFVVGALFGLFAMFGRLLRLRSENARLRGEVKKTARLNEQDLAVPENGDGKY
ncbi:lipopolysaccharide assembly LapA domain-containing protein [Neisseria leonii]|uniref:LapA family protein n=1 Tax=Neisseria leonii TaxID=2995413 RepID=UPI00237AF687|nr:lipopolysaccharide assembly protein LapA domain-containing protein [Neisseria sp. 3986]MDD9324907.1 lipopolysaccharide assembly protein LapA domain-containing protein [Neisseria sp. 3986]